MCHSAQKCRMIRVSSASILQIPGFDTALNLFIPMDYPIHIDAISKELSILYFKGLPVKISINR